jgi:hypothetical protein
MKKQGPITYYDGKKHSHCGYALIEAPIPNAPEGKYISQIPSPNNLLTAASALMSVGVPKESIKVFNFLKERRPPVVLANAIVYNMGEATCMDFLYNYAWDYLYLLQEQNPNSVITVIGYHAWLHRDEFSRKGFEVTEAHNFEFQLAARISGETDIKVLDAMKQTQYPNAWDLNDWDFMKKNVASKTKGIRCTFRASRGCPHKCKMCPVLQVYGARVQRYSVDWVMNEIDTLYHTYGIRQIGFLDDNLFFEKRWAKELLNRIIAGNYKGLSLTFEEGLDVPTALDEELLILMKKAHFTHVKLGVESFNDQTLEFIQKPYRRGELAIKAIKLLQKHKLSPVCFICIGFPHDTEESIRNDIQILKDLKVKLRVQILWAYPGVEQIQGKGLTQELLKELQRDAMYGTNSVAWRKKPKVAKQGNALDI